MTGAGHGQFSAPGNTSKHPQRPRWVTACWKNTGREKEGCASTQPKWTSLTDLPERNPIPAFEWPSLFSTKLNVMNLIAKLVGSYQMPSPSQLTLAHYPSLCGKHSYYPHLTSEETEAMRLCSCFSLEPQLWLYLWYTSRILKSA